MRASDAEREAVTARLRDHYAEGRLTNDELDERVSAALSAKTTAYCTARRSAMDWRNRALLAFGENI